ncbi:MAG: hypothetical protein B9S32_13180 [Verrucomicrobia bacterium Tous-C9LFEB]|nr:MAG: hypothetical protein B9S32_13180 [Verrucomicrobia bacterium Tous-C9LFEB]
MNKGAGASTSTATTYGMNELLYGRTLLAITAPAETCMAGETTNISGSWYMVTNRGNSVSAKVHTDHANYLYVDGHVAALDAVPASTTTLFWGL